MTMQPPEYDDPTIPDELLKKKSIQLSSELGISAKRIQRLLERASQAGMLLAINVQNEQHLHTPFDDTDRYLEPKDALSILEKENLVLLRNREAVFDYLADRDTPFYTLPELERQTAAFIENLEFNRDHLLKTGHPLRKFDNSRFLDWHLTKTYYTKLPTSTMMIREDSGNQLCGYGWSRKELARTTHPPPLNEREYARAPLIDGLSTQDAERLEALRTKLIEIKIAVLNELRIAAHTSSVEGLWTRCLNTVTEHLSADDAEFCLKIDRMYIGYDIKSGEIVDKEAGLIAGGLTDVLLVIGHYEKEINLGTIARTRKALGFITEKDIFNCPRLGIRSYYGVLQHPRRASIDRALDRFVDADSKEMTFWEEYRQRVNDALSNDFYTDVLVRVRIKRKVAHKFEPHIRTYSALVQSHIESTGSPPSLGITITAPRSRPPRIHIDEIESFSKVRRVPPEKTLSTLDNSGYCRLDRG